VLTKPKCALKYLRLVIPPTIPSPRPAIPLSSNLHASHSFRKPTTVTNPLPCLNLQHNVCHPTILPSGGIILPGSNHVLPGGGTLAPPSGGNITLPGGITVPATTLRVGTVVSVREDDNDVLPDTSLSDPVSLGRSWTLPVGGMFVRTAITIPAGGTIFIGP